MPNFDKPYVPSEEEIKKAKDSMTPGQKKMSEERIETFRAGQKSAVKEIEDENSLAHLEYDRSYFINELNNGINFWKKYDSKYYEGTLDNDTARQIAHELKEIRALAEKKDPDFNFVNFFPRGFQYFTHPERKSGKSPTSPSGMFYAFDYLEKYWGSNREEIISNLRRIKKELEVAE